MCFTFLRALSPCKPLSCKLRILTPVCYNCTGTTDTNRTLLTLFSNTGQVVISHLPFSSGM